jgi:hypothetical protein
MKHSVSAFLFVLSLYSVAYAQETTTSFIARLFDSPLFFGIVVGSGAILLVGSLVFLRYVKSLEKSAEQWGKGKSIEEVLLLLESPMASEAQSALIYLRNHIQPDDYPLLLAALQKQRDAGKINESLLFLIKDLGIVAAIPLMESIAKGKSSVAGMAADILAELKEIQEDEKKTDA